MNNLDMDFEKAFSCPTHGNSPTWVVSDGKNVGPLQKRVDHLTELSMDQSDPKILQQSTKSKDRVFLNSKKERMIICQLLTGDLTMRDFCEISEITSSNGLLLIELVRYILEKHPEEIPSCYTNFLANVCKPTSVRGLLQVLTPKPLEFLEKFCKRELNLRIHSSQKQLQCIVSSLPAIWPDLDKICFLENTEFLPTPVSNILLRMLCIRYKLWLYRDIYLHLNFRSQMFTNRTIRSNTDYVMWPNPAEEHPTQCYPNLPIWRYPSNYKAS